MSKQFVVTFCWLYERLTVPFCPVDKVFRAGKCVIGHSIAGNKIVHDPEILKANHLRITSNVPAVFDFIFNDTVFSKTLPVNHIAADSHSNFLNAKTASLGIVKHNKWPAK